MDDEPKPNRWDRFKDRMQSDHIKKHWQDHRREYIAGAGGVAIGYFLFHSAPQVKSITDMFNFKYKSPTDTTIINILERRECRPPFPVRDKLTGEPYGSLRRAADVTGESIYKIKQDAINAQTRFEPLPDSVFA